MIHRRGFWVQLVAINAAAASAGALVVVGLTTTFSWGRVWDMMWGSFVVSTIISSLCSVVLYRLAPYLFHHVRPWLRWTVLVGVLISLAAIGSLIAVTVIAVIGVIPLQWAPFVSTYRSTLATAIVITLIFGIYTTVNEALRSQLHDTTLALRTKERDEAEAQRLAAEAERASLEARVNPHFFFNTLNSIAALIREDPAGAERMTTQLASLMRSSLHDGSSPLLPLEQELEHVRDYLEIERVRFGERLRFDIQMADAVRPALVPRLSLQTLVENSVKYAVSPRREGASVTITAGASDSRVLIDVTDNGPGFDSSTAPEGHGLALVRSRLAMAFGDRARLAVSSRPGRTVVSVTVPLIALPI